MKLPRECLSQASPIKLKSRAPRASDGHASFSQAVQWAWPVGKPLVDSMGAGLWEIRSSLGNRIARTFFLIENQEIILLHGILKKSRTSPKQDIDLARKRRAQYLKFMKNSSNSNKHRGSDLRDFLAEKKILPEVEALAMKKAISLELKRILEEEHISKTQLATRMKTSRAALDRILDSSTASLTISTLAKAAAALGHRVRLQFEPA
jgi:phage-related protein/predicted XRE-type DNA-binding protein